jgi:hypothetical protein
LNTAARSSHSTNALEYRPSAPRILLRATSVFRNPLMADGSQVSKAIASAQRRDECGDSACNAQSEDDP